MWGNQPYDNDRAADWFAKLMDETNLPQRVRETIKKNLAIEYWDDEAGQVRAAVYCILQFGHVYVWSINSLKDDLLLGIEGLKRVLEDEEYCYSEEMTSIIQQEITELENRISSLQ